MKELLKNLKFAWKYAKKEIKKIFLYAFLSIIRILIDLVLPVLSSIIIVSFTENALIQVLQISIVLLLTCILEYILSFITRLLAQVIYKEAFIGLQIDLGREVLKLENECIDKNSSGVFIQRLTNDTSNIADVYNVLNIYISHIITNLGIFGVVFAINKLVFIYLVIMVVIVFYIEKRRTTILNENDKVYRKKSENVSGFISELVRGVRDIKMLNAEKSFIKELRGRVVDLNEYRYKLRSTDFSYSLVSNIVEDILHHGLIFLLVYLVYKGNFAIATALVIHNYMGRVTSIVYYGGMFLEKIKNFNLSSTRIFNIIDSDEFTKEKFGSEHISKVRGDFEFRNVNFSYTEGHQILRNISFHIKPKETVAFVGKSGSGKSTIFSLLCKMYDVESGNILIDGKDIQKLDKESIRGNITIINQSPYIFNMSIRDNLKLVKEDLTDEEMIRACKLSCLDELINVLPDKYDTMVGEGGITLSGGQRQRLAIARALVQDTRIILFDEATSALDNETQKAIQEAIDNLKNDYTILIIAHRLSTIINCDRILFLDDGCIIAEGDHNKLLKTCPEYKKLYDAEMKK